MSQGFHLAQSQKMALSQVLSPQMQQSLAMLQAPILELKALVDQELEQNPVLEEVASTEVDQEGKETREKEETAERLDPAEPPADTQIDPTSEKGAGEPVDDFQAEFDRLAQMDQEWRDHFAQTNLPMRQSAEDEEKRQFMFDSLVAETSLQEMLLEQVRTSDLPQEKRPVAEMIVGNIDDHGYLRAKVEELAFSTNIPSEDILAVLKTVQTFQPPGVGARDLRECLLLQLERAGKQNSLEYRVVRDYMDALGRRRFPEIARGLGVDVETAQEIAERIGHLDPRPGLAFLPESAGQYIVPEVFVSSAGKMSTPDLAGYIQRQLDDHFAEADDFTITVCDAAVAQVKKHYDHDGGAKELQRLLDEFTLTDAQKSAVKDCLAQLRNNEFVISTNNDQIPHLRISNTYKDLMANADSSTEVRQYIRSKIQAGKFLIKSLHQRQQTILNIARQIVNRQREFMEKGVAHLKPLTMAQVAEVVGVHETTVSRAVSGKYMETPQGVFEMKYFFTSGFTTASGQGMSNTSIKDMITGLIKSENPASPLSDDAIVKQLTEKGIPIARRTVAKYRSELNILPSNLRRVY